MKYLVEIGLFQSCTGNTSDLILFTKLFFNAWARESLVELNWENNLPEFIKLAYLPAIGRVRLKLSTRGKDKAFRKCIRGICIFISLIINDILVHC
jgi:nicotinamide-nucleotide amidase